MLHCNFAYVCACRHSIYLAVRSKGFAGLLALVLLSSLVRPAKAADTEQGQAQAHLQKATAAYNLGYYAEAAREYEAAYGSTLEAALLFNVGDAWRLAGERQKAVTAFRSYVRTAQSGDQVAAAQAKIKELEQPRLEQGTATPWVNNNPQWAVPVVPRSEPVFMPNQAQLTNAPLTAATQPRPSDSRWVAWTVVGAVLGAGVVLGIVLASRGGDLAMPTTTYGTNRY